MILNIARRGCLFTPKKFISYTDTTTHVTPTYMVQIFSNPKHRQWSARTIYEIETKLRAEASRQPLETRHDSIRNWCVRPVVGSLKSTRLGYVVNRPSMYLLDTSSINLKWQLHNLGHHTYHAAGIVLK